MATGSAASRSVNFRSHQLTEKLRHVSVFIGLHFELTGRVCDLSEKRKKIVLEHARSFSAFIYYSVQLLKNVTKM